MLKIYTGIGSRETPKHILEVISKISSYLSKDGFVLRSGGAVGADLAFEKGCCSGNKEIYLHWRGFNGNASPLFILSEEAYSIAKQYHPRWDSLSDAVKKYHCRNVYQVLGYDLETPTIFIICWTKDGKFTGGTGQALRIANDKNILIYNLHNKDHLDFWIKKIGYNSQ